MSWSSSNPTVASVSPTGLVTARSNGTATIKATFAGASGPATITVAQKVVTISITPAAVTLTAIKKYLQLSAAVKDEKNQPIPNAPVSWSSSKTSVVSVSPRGLATAQGNGKVTITAKSGGKSSTAEITADTKVPLIVAGTVSDGDVKVDFNQINADGFRYEFDEPIIGSIKLTDEAGESLNWIANVLGQTATLTVVPGKELVGETTYKIEIDVKDSVGNRTEQTITFVTDIKR